MKKTKFRVWNPGYKQIAPWEEIAFQPSHLTECTSHGDNPTHFHLAEVFKLAEDEKNVFMENTGLIDKNGKEIYEGDIVRFTFSSKVGKVGTLGVMGFNENLGQFGVTLSLDLDMPQHVEVKESEHGRPEVVGNIYETPELLKLIKS